MFLLKTNSNITFSLSSHHPIIVCLCAHVHTCAHIHISVLMNLVQFSLQNAHYKRQGQCSSWSNWSCSNSEGRYVSQWCSPHFLYPATNLGTLSHPQDLHAASGLLRALFQSPFPMQGLTQTWSCLPFSYTECPYLGSCSHKIMVSPNCLTGHVMTKGCILDWKSEWPYITEWPCSFGNESLNFSKPQFPWISVSFSEKKCLSNETCTILFTGGSNET